MRMATRCQPTPCTLPTTLAAAAAMLVLVLVLGHAAAASVSAAQACGLVQACGGALRASATRKCT